jgi:hypothetical protein
MIWILFNVKVVPSLFQYTLRTCIRYLKNKDKYKDLVIIIVQFYIENTVR